MASDKKPVLEKRIEDLDEKLPYSDQEFGWLTSPRFVEYLDAWSDLEKYYYKQNASDKIQLSAFVFASYIRVTETLHEILRQDKYEQYHEAAQQCLDSIIYTMDLITTTAYTLRHGEEDLEEENRLRGK